MPLSNTSRSYGSVTKTFHWLIALLILTTIPVGLIASDLAAEIRSPDSTATDATLARATWLFSLHKTIGVAIFFTAIARVLWALSQHKPGLLNGDHRVEAWLAVTVHWLLYGSLILVPLTGWVHHAASAGFAPIWWPLPQTLPLVPRDAAWSETAATLHYILQWVLIGAVVLHIAGALKHHLIDRDATLTRMRPGGGEGVPTAQQPGHVLPFFSALAIWAVALGAGGAMGWFAHPPTGMLGAAQLAEVSSEWQVQDGALQIEVTQMGTPISGTFSDWTADIAYSETAADDGRHGHVTVVIAIASLTLGSVADQAMGADYFDAASFETATFDADLIARDAALVADGTLTIKGETVPVSMPVTVQIDPETDMATASGALSVDRRSFGIGASVGDEATLGFGVEISFDLTATRQSAD